MTLSRPAKVWRARVFTATWVSYASYYFCRKPFYIAKSTLETELSWDAEMLGQLGAAYLIAYTIGQFVSAFAGDRWGPRVLVLVGSAVSVACNVAFGLTNSFVTFAVFIFINGLAQSSGWPGNVASMATWFRRRERGTVMGLWATNFQVGGVVANIMAAYVLGATGGKYQYSFFLGALVLVVAWVIFLFNQRDRPEDAGLEPIIDEDDAPVGEDGRSVDRWTKNVWANVLLVGMFYFFVKFIRYSVWSWAPYLLDRYYGLEADEAGYLSTIFDVTGVFGVIACGYVSDKFFGGRRARISFFFILAMTVGCGMLYLLGTKDLTLFAVSIGVIGFFLYGPDALMTGAGAIEAGTVRSAAKAAGIINGMGSLGSVMQEFVLGRIIKDGSVGSTFAALVASAMMAAVLLGVLLLRNRSGKADL